MPYEKRLIEDSLPLEAISKQSAREKKHPPRPHQHPAHLVGAPSLGRHARRHLRQPRPRAKRRRRTKIPARSHHRHRRLGRGQERQQPTRPRSARAHPPALPGGPAKSARSLHGRRQHRLGSAAARLRSPWRRTEPGRLSHRAMHPGLSAEIRAADRHRPRYRTIDAAGAGRHEIRRHPHPNPLAEDVRKWGKWVLEEARKEIGHLYDDPCGHTIVGYIWARTAICPNPACGAEMPMLRQTWLANKKNKKVALRMKVDRAAKSIDFEVVEGDAIDFDPTDMTMKRGTIVCPVCGNSPDRDFLGREGRAKRLGERMLAVIYSQTGQKGKFYRESTRQDAEQFQEATQRLENIVAGDPSLVPTEATPNRRSRSVSIQVYGLMEWQDLFNARQSLMLSTLIAIVKSAYEHMINVRQDEEYARAIVTLLACTVDRMAAKASSLVAWQSTAEKLGHTFGRQALAMVWDYAELNPFSTATGNWAASVDWVAKVVEHGGSSVSTRGSA